MRVSGVRGVAVDVWVSLGFWWLSYPSVSLPLWHWEGLLAPPAGAILSALVIIAPLVTLFHDLKRVVFGLMLVQHLTGSK